MRLIKTHKDIIELEFETQQEMATSLLRFQEYYEGEGLKGKIFTYGMARAKLLDSIHWADYENVVDGMNIPSFAFKPFIQGLFDPLTEEEVEVIETIKFKRGKYSVIGYYEDCDTEIKNHERSHAMFYISEEYKEAAKKLWSEYSEEYSKVSSYIVNEMGYINDDNIVLDEATAYVACSKASWGDSDVFAELPSKLFDDFAKLYHDYVGSKLSKKLLQGLI